MEMKPGSNSNKRSFVEYAEEDDPSEQEVASMSRSERKRHREKKRRSDVNKGFDELMALLLEIDPEVRADAEERASKGQCKRSLGAHEDNVLSRVDLIATAIKVLKRVHVENEKHKKMIEEIALKNSVNQSADASLARSSASLSCLPVSGGRADLGPFGVTSSLVDRASLLQKSALGLGGSGASAGPSNSYQQAWETAQLRAQANLRSGAGGAPSLREYSTADIFAMRAAAVGRTGSAASLPPTPSAIDTSALLAARRQLLQTMMQQQQNSQSNLMIQEAFFGSSLQGDGSVPPHLMGAEGLYSALGGGAMQTKKDEELRRLRAAGHQL